jgi:hypothetical protein
LGVNRYGFDLRIGSAGAVPKPGMSSAIRAALRGNEQRGKAATTNACLSNYKWNQLNPSDSQFCAHMFLPIPEQ